MVSSLHTTLAVRLALLTRAISPNASPACIYRTISNCGNILAIRSLTYDSDLSWNFNIEGLFPESGEYILKEDSL